MTNDQPLERLASPPLVEVAASLTWSRGATCATCGIEPETWNSSSSLDVALDRDTGEAPITRRVIERWAASEPGRLLALIDRESLEPVLLTFAAEALGGVPAVSRPRAVAALRRLLCHDDCVVREGAVYGLAALAADDPRLLDALKPLRDDPSPGVRASALEALT